MKTINDLPKDINLQQVKVKLPQDIYEMSSLPLYKLDNVPVYLQGWIMGDFFVKINPEETKIYPMFWDNIPEEIENWEVIE
jgi:hypothetical protein